MIWRRLISKVTGLPAMGLQRPGLGVHGLVVSGLVVSGLVLSAGCGDGDIRKGCKNYCRCHRGNASDSACRKRCSERLSALKKRDRPLARQIADCLAAKGERSCKELAACAGDALK